MVTEEIVKSASNEGLPKLKELFEKLPKEDALKAIGMLVIGGYAWGVTRAVINSVKEIVMHKQ